MRFGRLYRPGKVKRVVAREMVDDLDVDDAELAASFDDLECANRYFGGLTPTINAILNVDARSVLDVGCGSGDVVRALHTATRRRGLPVTIVALDLSPRIVAVARSRSVGAPDIEFAVGDGTALPYPDGAFDVAMCNLALHHFEPPEAVCMLRELRRVSRITPLVSDLVRSRVGYLAALAFARVIVKSQCAKNDAPLSVRRAYDRHEVLELLKRADWCARTYSRNAVLSLRRDGSRMTTGSSRERRINVPSIVTAAIRRCFAEMSAAR